MKLNTVEHISAFALPLHHITAVVELMLGVAVGHKLDAAVEHKLVEPVELEHCKPELVGHHNHITEPGQVLEQLAGEQVSLDRCDLLGVYKGQDCGALELVDEQVPAEHKLQVVADELEVAAHGKAVDDRLAVVGLVVVPCMLDPARKLLLVVDAVSVHLEVAQKDLH